MSATLLLVLSLGAWRAASVVPDDVIARGLRRRAARRWPPRYAPGTEEYEPHPLVELVNCARCQAVWTSLALVAGAWALGLVDGPGFAVGWPAVAGGAALLVRLDR